ELANEFVADPHKVVKPGQIVQVRVLNVDAERNRSCQHIFSSNFIINIFSH
ncbi:MAG: S1 RNA-binding domain-containing protein, partial [Lachnospiraceae bacterium]|nr:S1 RNA-binding domain-containing protein [Lachnospiraceae bacterium]